MLLDMLSHLKEGQTQIVGHCALENGFNLLLVEECVPLQLCRWRVQSDSDEDALIFSLPRKKKL